METDYGSVSTIWANLKHVLISTEGLVADDLQNSCLEKTLNVHLQLYQKKDLLIDALLWISEIIS